jgi:hypothetical protein
MTPRLRSGFASSDKVRVPAQRERAPLEEIQNAFAVVVLSRQTSAHAVPTYC